MQYTQVIQSHMNAVSIGGGVGAGVLVLTVVFVAAIIALLLFIKNRRKAVSGICMHA